MTQFLHGAEVIEIDDGSRPIQTVKSAVIGLVGTAPLSAAATSAALTIGTAILNDGLKFTAVKTGTEGNAISVEVLAPTAASAELAVTVNNNKISIQLASDESGELTSTATELASALMADPAAKALVTAVGLGDGSGDVAPASRSYLSGGENESFPLKKPVAVAGSRKLIEKLAKEIDRPSSARQAGLRARIDAEKGFWWSKSNQEIYGIVGTSQPVDWALGDPNTTANMLNENKVSTIIREGGFRHWGNRTCSTDPKWTFEQTRRTADMINDSVQRSHLWAVDRNITKTYVDDVISGVNAYLRELKALGAILGGECWADKELNTPATIQKGIVYFDFDFCPPYPAEHIVFRSRLNNAYLEEVFS
ncbi:phage tail protein [Vibrio cholerae]|uniref:phage tail sheath C-terminal domain-containing protein n=1 Tax=Vibrio cholerae TaxID=666 RepID=UPI000615A201|nr:phage tail sheath C-terminal domain-containing protein [Vibrio cholerae]AKB04480.1 phage tail sheath family protein [Vibrio cholerae]EGR2419337.1 phage tail protein [Vibrio cholerae]TYA64813.1 phage tail protein [Vibrio cholerae]GIB91908.1 phage tail sheath family protein [Vibrio cholerae]